MLKTHYACIYCICISKLMIKLEIFMFFIQGGHVTKKSLSYTFQVGKLLLLGRSTQQRRKGECSAKWKKYGEGGGGNIVISEKPPRLKNLAAETN